MNLGRPPRAVTWCVVLMMILGAAGVSAAQDAGIRGTVVDPLGSRVAGATVRVLGGDAPVAREATSDAEGAFVVTGLAAGRYDVEVAAAGFQVRRIEQAFVAAGSQLVVAISLPLGPVETSVTVTATATETLPSQVGAPVTVLDAPTLDAIGKVDVIEALRLVPGSALVQTGGHGSSASAFIRGGNANFNKILVDGVPANDIGGAMDLSQLSLAGVDRVEVLREANSVSAGADALAGIVSITTRRGRTRVPEVTLSLDGGSLGTGRQSAAVGGVAGRAEFFGEFAHFATSNDQPNNDYGVKTFAGRFGARVARLTDVTGTIRWIDRRYESPNAMRFYGTPDDAYQTDGMRVIGIGSQTQLSDRWQASVRVGLSDQRAHFVNPTLSGEDAFGIGLGDEMTIAGANGYSVTGRGILDWGPYDSETRAARQGIYAQTSYLVGSGWTLSAGGNYEREQAFTDPDADPATTRHNGALWTEARGAVADRVSVTAGLGYAHIEGFESRLSPRVSLAWAMRPPAAGAFWSDTRMTLNAGRGVKAASVSAANSSLYALLVQTPEGAALAERANIGPVAPERSRTFDLGIEQGLWHGRARVRAAYFNSAFYDLVEFVGRNQLPQFGVPTDVADAVGFGAYVNSQSFDAQGIELSLDARVGRIRVGGSYTYLDAIVRASLSTSASPEFNPAFPGVPIGGYTALVGERPFRRPANVGSALVTYTDGPVVLALTGYFAGKSDESTYMVGSDASFGNSLLLPNQDLNFGYAKVDVSGSWLVTARVKLFGTIENLLGQDYQPSFGYPALPATIRAGASVTLGGR